MVAIAAIAISSGDPNRLLYGSDYKGRTCGTISPIAGTDPPVETDLTDKLLTYYPRLVEDVVAFAQSGSTNPLDLNLYGVCVSECPAKGTVVCDDEGEPVLVQAVADEGDGATRPSVWAEAQTLSGWLSLGEDTARAIKGHCWYVPLDSLDYFYRCLWQRSKEEHIEEMCLSPPSMAGVMLTEETTQAEYDSCITKRRITTTIQEGEAQENPVITQLFDATEKIGRYVGDAQNASLVIWCVGLGLSAVLGYVFLLLARKFAGCMVWTVVFLTILIFILMTFMSFVKAGIISSDDINSVSDDFASVTGGAVNVTEVPGDIADAADGTQQEVWTWIAYVMTALTLILIVLVVFWSKKIKIAIAVIREASDAVRKMPLMLVLPILSTICIAVLVVYFLAIAAYISSGTDIQVSDITDAANDVANDVASATGVEAEVSVNLNCVTDEDGEVDPNTCIDPVPVIGAQKKSSLNDILLAVHFFGFLWTNQFIQGISIVIIAGAVSRWYFTHDKATELPKYPLKDAIKITFRYHLGSIAFGSLVIAIVQFIRAVLEYLNKQSQEAQKKNMILRIFFKVIRCCLWCFEKCIKFLTAYAFIIVAMQGKSFCTSCKEVVMMIIKNPVQIGVVNAITAVLFFLGKIGIALTCCLAAFQWFENDATYQRGGENALDSYSFPLLIILLFSYAVATVFMNVFALGVDTILLCFLFDRDLNNGDDKPYFMTATLLKAIGASTKKNKAITGQTTESDDEAEAAAETAASAPPAATAGGGAAAAADGGGGAGLL